MNLHQFLNRARTLRHIELRELEAAGFDPAKWPAFCRDPVTFLMRCDDDTAAKVWAVAGGDA